MTTVEVARARSKRKLPATIRYSIALAATGVAIWIRNLLHPMLGVECPFSLFYLSVLITAWLAGTGPGVVAMCLGTLAAAHLFVYPESSLWIEKLADQIHLVIFVLVNLVAMLLFHRLEYLRKLAENRSRENEELGRSLREADARKDEFLALLAHELRNPLAPIRTCLSLLDKKPGCADVMQRVRTVVGRQVLHLVRITEDLLDVSRFNRGKLELRIQWLDLREAVADAIEMTEELFSGKAQKFQSLVPDVPVWIKGDRLRLAQLTANLIGNASKYTPRDGRITLQLENFDSTISLAVSDNGIGFSRDDGRRIMQPFVQLDASRTREYGGLGVGLTIVQRLVELHGGTLNAFSRGPGLGSCFTVTFNACEPDQGAGLPVVEENETELPAEPCPAELPPMKLPSILIVDDNVDAAELLGEMFAAEGFEVQLSYDGIDALKKIQAAAPDVVILDIGLPGMDGYEVARRIRRCRHARDLQLIALSGWGGPADIDKSMECGFDLHLVKPTVFSELLDCIQQLADNRANHPPREVAPLITRGTSLSISR